MVYALLSHSLTSFHGSNSTERLPLRKLISSTCLHTLRLICQRRFELFCVIAVTKQGSFFRTNNVTSAERKEKKEEGV